MKHILFGGFLSLIGTLWALAILLSAGNNLTSGWTTPPGRLLTTVSELGMTFPLVLAVLCVLAGLSFMVVGLVRKDG